LLKAKELKRDVETKREKEREKGRIGKAPAVSHARNDSEQMMYVGQRGESFVGRERKMKTYSRIVKRRFPIRFLNRAPSSLSARGIDFFLALNRFPANGGRSTGSISSLINCTLQTLFPNANLY